jgi:hypothetical protein
VLKTLSEKHGVRKVFVSSDASQDELLALRAASVPLVLIVYKAYEMKGTPLLSFNTGKGSLQLALVEQIICSHARAFVGTDGSHFSKEIHLERKARMLRAGVTDLDTAYIGTSYSMVAKGRTRGLCTSWQQDESELGCEMLPLD